MADTTKRCWKCGETRPIERFELRRDTGRRREVCRSCITKQQAAALLRRDPEYNRRVYWANREERLAAHKVWRTANKAYVSQKHREWRKAHPEHGQYIKAWREAHRDRLSHYNAKRRALEAKRTTEIVLRSEVLRRGAGICGICGDPVDPSRFHVDHIIPLSRGGEHSYANTQPAHPTCNQRKKNRLPEEMAA